MTTGLTLRFVVGYFAAERSVDHVFRPLFLVRRYETERGPLRFLLFRGPRMRLSLRFGRFHLPIQPRPFSEFSVDDMLVEFFLSHLHNAKQSRCRGVNLLASPGRPS